MTGTISILRMANTLLFCVAEEAKPVSYIGICTKHAKSSQNFQDRKVLDTRLDIFPDTGEVAMLYLIKSYILQNSSVKV